MEKRVTLTYSLIWIPRILKGLESVWEEVKKKVKVTNLNLEMERYLT